MGHGGEAAPGFFKGLSHLVGDELPVRPIIEIREQWLPQLGHARRHAIQWPHFAGGEAEAQSEGTGPIIPAKFLATQDCLQSS